MATRLDQLSILHHSPAKLRRTITHLRSEIKTFKQTLALESRKTHNDRLVENIARSTGQAPANVLLQLIRREESRRNARIIRWALKPPFGGAVSMVQTLAPDGSINTLTAKAEMEAAIMEECNTRFRQASTTDFLQPPLYERVGPLGITSFCDRVLTGTLSSDDFFGVSEYAEKLLRCLQRPPPLRDKFTEVVPSLETFQYRWKRMRAQTASYPGRHFGHLMAGATRDSIAEFHRQLEYLPMLTGEPPPSWRKAIDVMIEKKAGNFRVDKLRAICLFDCIANHSFKQIGKSMMASAEECGLLAKEQGGSRKGHRANYIGLEKRLSFDLSRQFKEAMALCSNDARACYDRIVHSVASLCLQRVGVPRSAAVCMFTTIQQLEHHICTIFGDSEAHFGGDGDKSLYAVPISTIGQGNGAAPQIWALVSTPILDMLRGEGLGMSFQCTLFGDQVSFVGYSFVDDTDLGVCGSHLPSSQDVAHEMQRSMDHWQGGLRATGGAIAPEKTFWYLIDYQWHQGTWTYKLERDCPAEITVCDMHGVRQVIQRCSVHHAERTLGIYLSPDGCDKAQASILLQKSRAWGARLKQSRLPRSLAIPAYTSTIDKSLSYPTVATCLTRQQCHQIQSPAMTAALQCSGVGKDIPLSIRTAPIRFQGLGLPHLYTTQLYTHLEAIFFSNDQPCRNTSQLIRASSEALKLEVGCNGYLFSNDYNRLALATTPCWMQFTWSCCHRHGIQVTDSLPSFQPRRIADTLLMELFLQSPMSPTDLATMNKCRLFLQVLYVSDITHANGKTITQSAWEGMRDKTRLSTMTWPVQGKPSPAAWHTWRRYLQQLLCNPNRLLNCQLGQWYTPSTTTRFFYDKRMDHIYELAEGRAVLYCFDGKGRRCRVCIYRRMTDTVISMPPQHTLQCASVQLVPGCHNKLYLLNVGDQVPVDPTSVLTNTLARMRHMLPPSTRWVLAHVQLGADQGETIVEAIRNQSCIAVSDGSYDPVLNTGAAATTIQGSNSANAISASCTTPGSSSSQSAYRSELAGIYQTVVIIHLLCEIHQITSGQVVLACDGISALREATHHRHPTSLSQKHFDIISAIRTIIRDTDITWKTHHVLGHQRDKGPGHQPMCGPLDRWASLNDDMDYAAKRQANIAGTMARPMILWFIKQ